MTSPESNVGLTPLPPCPWWKNGVGDTLPPKAEGGTLRRDEGTATDNKGTSGMDSCGGRPCKSGAASEAATDRDLRCCLLSPSAVLPDISCSLDPELDRAVIRFTTLSGIQRLLAKIGNGTDTGEFSRQQLKRTFHENVLLLLLRCRCQWSAFVAKATWSKTF